LTAVKSPGGPPDAWKIGGGTVWGWISYDPELNLIYYGTGNPRPWNPDQRPGDNKWTAAMFARNPDTGEAAWAYQWTPHDLHDYDGVNELILSAFSPKTGLLYIPHNNLCYDTESTEVNYIAGTPFVGANVKMYAGPGGHRGEFTA
jgi:glucose dehydrogenase